MKATVSMRGLARCCALVAIVMAAGCGEGEVASSPAPKVAAAAHAPAPMSPVVAAAAPPVAEMHEALPEPHDAQPSAACLAKTGDGATISRETSIHRWVDAGGVTHYSDQAPTAPVSGHRVLEVHGLPPVKVEASGYDVNLPPDLERRAVVDTLAVQRVFHDTLGIDGPAGMSLRIVFVGNAASYAKLVGEPALAASAGAYVPPQHTIYVRMQANDEISFAILRHEITHALIHEWVGNLPVPLNEGLAEYFRRYRVAGMGGEIDIAADRGALTGAAPAGDGEEALVELLALTGPAFYAADRDRRYERAYALVARLLSSPEGTAALHEVLARQKADPCVPVLAEGILEARYPGGLKALAADWASFLHDPPAAVRTY
jgi:uncharacterized protein DUF4124